MAYVIIFGGLRKLLINSNACKKNQGMLMVNGIPPDLLNFEL